MSHPTPLRTRHLVQVSTVMLAVLALASAALGACKPAGSTTTTTTTKPPSTTTTAKPTTTTTKPPTTTTSTTTTTTPSSGPVDLTHLPVGDGKYTTTPKAGYIYTCQTTFNGGGASAKGPWFNSDGTTWDATKKGVVDGSVTWPHSFSESDSSSTRTFSGNDLPDHKTGTYPIGRTDDVWQYDGNPNSISAQTLSVNIPLNPTVAAQPTCIRGEVGIALSGAAIFDGFDAGGRDAVAWEAQDQCQGHPQNTGAYHYHSLTSCIADPGTGHSNLLGYAYDGFGIYGLRGEDGKEVTDADLDACHGHTHTITWNGKQVVMYHYHATREFPYTVGCFKGTPSQNRFSG
jgi:hypothetical protein